MGFKHDENQQVMQQSSSFLAFLSLVIPKATAGIANKGVHKVSRGRNGFEYVSTFNDVNSSENGARTKRFDFIGLSHRAFSCPQALRGILALFVFHSNLR